MGPPASAIFRHAAESTACAMRARQRPARPSGPRGPRRRAVRRHASMELDLVVRLPRRHSHPASGYDNRRGVGLLENRGARQFLRLRRSGPTSCRRGWCPICSPRSHRRSVPARQSSDERQGQVATPSTTSIFMLRTAGNDSSLMAQSCIKGPGSMIKQLAPPVAVHWPLPANNVQGADTVIR